MSDSIYDSAFYDDQEQGSLRSARIVLGELRQWIQPKRVLDIGCGLGTWLSAAVEQGAEEVLGLDGAYVDRRRLKIPASSFLEADLENAPVDELLGGRRFDLAICLEVAEHVRYERSGAFVHGLVAGADVVLFSAAVPYQDGTGHVNEQWPEFWAMLFRDRGYACYDILRSKLWANPDVEWWYSQNALVFVKEGSAAQAAFPMPAAMEGALARVHPLNFLAQTLYAFRPLRALMRGLEETDFRRLTAAWHEQAAVPALVTPTAQADVETGLGFPDARMRKLDVEAEMALLRSAGAQEAQRSAELTGLLSEQANEVTRLAAELTRAQQALSAQTGRADALEAAVNALHQSTSWRVTRPLRALKKMIGGGS